MAKKSDNTKGNPYHDEGTGEFTSPNSNGGKMLSIRFKANVDLNAAKLALQQQLPQQKTIGDFKEATSIEEAVAVGRSILPDCLVNYSSGCDLEKVNELNKALNDIAHRFPSFVENGLLNAYGDGLSLGRDEMLDTVTKSALNVVQTDAYFKALYDDFFIKSKERFNLKDEDKYNENIFSHFMCLDRQFNVNDYTERRSGGGALAYYQVSQRNIFNAGEGGAGINGAIKFYPNILKKATPDEIADNVYAVKKGFHFDYGGHSYTYATGVHELGHSIFTIAYKKCNAEERAEIDQLLRDGAGKDRREVSGYGHTNYYEQEAESVADVMCRGENATPHNRKMVAWLDKVQKRLKGE